MMLRDFVQSGRFDATEAEAGTMLTRARTVATVGACTEAMKLHAPEGWDRAGRESAVFWDTTAWELLDHGVESIPTPPWKRGTSTRTSVEITWALLGHKKTGKTMLRLVGHLPAHLFRPSQRRANLAALSGLRGLIRVLQHEQAPDHTAASFDLNRDLRFKRTRKLVNQSLHGTGLALVVPPKGTHRLRKIDGYLTTCPLAVAEMLPRFSGFDHRGFRVRTCFS